ncbi:MAG: hypothetical protein IMF06_07010 [Proteobacteria bacterium]|nr:hypothetical protein [Pseudomonadota bacterium]
MTKKLNHLLIVMLALVLAKGAAAGEIDIASLGDLSLAYQRVDTVSSYPGQKIAAEVTFKKGEAYTLAAPRRIQQIRYLVEVGALVEKGQPLAELRGPEMHHFLTEMEVARKLLLSAERRFVSNKKLFEKKAIKESQWAEVSEKYYAAQLEYEHMRHFNDLVLSIDEADDSLVIGAPVSGVVNYSLEYNGLSSGDDIAVMVPMSAIRLEAAVPASSRKNLAYLKMASCELKVSSIGAIISNFFVSAWSEPLTSKCNLMLGQNLLVTPLYKTQAYKVPMTAVFQWGSATSVLVRDGGLLRAVEVELIASRNMDYIVSCNDSLAGADVLISSVSAVQGILIGLGGE